jgi:hypothetical protein
MTLNALSVAVRSHVVDRKSDKATPGATRPRLDRSENAALRAWRRRLARAGGDPMRLAPRSGALEWI